MCCGIWEWAVERNYKENVIFFLKLLFLFLKIQNLKLNLLPDFILNFMFILLIDTKDQSSETNHIPNGPDLTSCTNNPFIPFACSVSKKETKLR